MGIIPRKCAEEEQEATHPHVGPHHEPRICQRAVHVRALYICMLACTHTLIDIDCDL